MLNGTIGKSKAPSLMGEYASLLGDAVLRQRAREAEHAAHIEAELAQRVKSEFLANMSHELRTPLNTMIGFSKILSEHDRRPLVDADIVEYANLIHNAANHLLLIINDILDITKIQSGRYTLDRRETNIEEIIQGSISSLRTALSDAGLTIETRISSNLPMVRGDAGKLGQIFNNLLSNAIKFTLPGGRIALEAIRTADGGLAVIVRDTGVGMSEEEIAVALAPFGQVDGTRTRWREGTGLGLPIAKALVELHGGVIKITSAKGQGTEVSVVLPPPEQVTVSEARDALLGHGNFGR